MKNLLLLLVMLAGYVAMAQTHPEYKVENGVNLQSTQPEKEFDNIHVQKLAFDSLSSSFVIWVKESVALHKHVNHTENVYVLEGEGEMTVGDKTFKLVPGSFVFIPADTPHSVVVDRSKGVMKVLSVQSPNFDGSDRVMVESSK